MYDARIRLRALGKRLAQRRVATSFASWRVWPRERALFNYRWGQVFQRWQERIARQVLRTWLSRVRRSQFAFRVLMPRLRRLQLASMGRTLVAWHEHTQARGGGGARFSCLERGTRSCSWGCE